MKNEKQTKSPEQMHLKEQLRLLLIYLLIAAGCPTSGLIGVMAYLETQPESEVSDFLISEYNGLVRQDAAMYDSEMGIEIPAISIEVLENNFTVHSNIFDLGNGKLLFAGYHKTEGPGIWAYEMVGRNLELLQVTDRERGVTPMITGVSGDGQFGFGVYVGRGDTKDIGFIFNLASKQIVFEDSSIRNLDWVGDETRFFNINFHYDPKLDSHTLVFDIVDTASQELIRFAEGIPVSSPIEINSDAGTVAYIDGIHQFHVVHVPSGKTVLSIEDVENYSFLDSETLFVFNRDSTNREYSIPDAMANME